MGVVAGAFSGTLPAGSFGEDYHSEDENELYQDKPNWKSLTPAKQILLDYAISNETGGVWDMLDTTKAGDPDFVELEVNPQTDAPRAHEPDMPPQQAGLPQQAGGWDAVREGWETEGPEAMWKLLCLPQTGPTTILPVFVLYHLLLLLQGQRHQEEASHVN